MFSRRPKADWMSANVERFFLFPKIAFSKKRKSFLWGYKFCFFGQGYRDFLYRFAAVIFLKWQL